MTDSVFYRLANWTTWLALFVVVLGAYVRLSGAGLGCPDWPGCYGQLTVPQNEAAVAQANAGYPERPLEAPKAWKEMVHRYFAGTLGLLILVLALVAWRHRNQRLQPPVALPLFLVSLVIFQALLGMWTVTLLVKPVIVVAHLLGGMATLGLLAWLALRTGPILPLPMRDAKALRAFRPLAVMGLIVVVAQIALGGWTSANYAALICPDFPTCQGQWWPSMDFREAFTLWRGIGIDYEGGVLGNDARVTIHVIHRLGALVTLLYLGWLAWRLFANGRSLVARNLGVLLGLVLLVQIGLGIANVLFSLPLALATAHNGVAALLLMTLVLINHSLRPH